MTRMTRVDDAPRLRTGRPHETQERMHSEITSGSGRLFLGLSRMNAPNGFASGAKGLRELLQAWL